MSSWCGCEYIEEALCNFLDWDGCNEAREFNFTQGTTATLLDAWTLSQPLGRYATPRRSPAPRLCVCKQITHTPPSINVFSDGGVSCLQPLPVAASLLQCVAQISRRWESEHIDLQTTPWLVCTNSYRLFSTAVIAQACSSHRISALAASC